MWNLDKDPHLTSVFANVTVLDCPPDREYLRRKLGRAVLEIPRLRQRVVPAFGRLAPPTWEEDPDLRPRLPPAVDGAGRHGRRAGPDRAGHPHPPAALRTGAAAVGVRRRGRPARRSGGHGPEAAPHGHRRGGRPPPGRALPGPRALPRRTRWRPARDRADQRWVGAVGRGSHAGHRRPSDPSGDHDRHRRGPRHRRRAGAARPVAGAPGRRLGDHALGRPPAGRHQRRPIAAVDRAVPVARAGRAPGATSTR